MPGQSVAFDRAADYYDETRGFPPGHEIQVAELFRRIGSLTPGSRLLEIGIGTGRIALPLAPLVHSITGIDLSRPMMDRLRTKQVDERVMLVQGDAAHLPFRTHGFDALLAVHVFHLIADWQGALREAARVLRPGGVLLSAYNDSGRRAPQEDVLWQAWEDVVKESQLPNVGVQRDQFGSFLVDQGWRKAGEGGEHHYMVTRTPQDFLNRLEQRIWSSSWRLPDAVVERGLAAVRETMQRHNLDPQQRVAFESVFKVTAYRPPQ